VRSRARTRPAGAEERGGRDGAANAAGAASEPGRRDLTACAGWRAARTVGAERRRGEGERREAPRREGAGRNLGPAAPRGAANETAPGSISPSTRAAGAVARDGRESGDTLTPGGLDKERKRGKTPEREGGRPPDPGGDAGKAPKSDPGAAAGARERTTRAPQGEGGEPRGRTGGPTPGPGRGRRDRSEETNRAPTAGARAAGGPDRDAEAPSQDRHGPEKGGPLTVQVPAGYD